MKYLYNLTVLCALVAVVAESRWNHAERLNSGRELGGEDHCRCQEKHVLKVRQIEIVDDAGKVVGRLGSFPWNHRGSVPSHGIVSGAVESGALLEFYDSSGKSAINLSSFPTGGTLTLSGEDGHEARLKAVKYMATLQLASSAQTGSEFWAEVVTNRRSKGPTISLTRDKGTEDAKSVSLYLAPDSRITLDAPGQYRKVVPEKDE